MGTFGKFKQTLDWDVETCYAIVGGNILSQEEIESGTQPQNTSGNELVDYKVIVHSETKRPLHVCKVSYQPTKNSDFMNFVQELSQLTGAPVEGYVEFRDGEIVLAYLKEENTFLGGYETENYIVVGNSHNGTKPLFIGHCNHMIRCTNQFGTITQESSVYHTKSQKARMAVVLEAFEKYKTQKEAFEKNMTLLASIKLTDEDITELTSKLLKLDAKKKKDSGVFHGKTMSIIDAVNDSVRHEINELGSTLFGWFNGITYYTSNSKKTKNPIFGNLFGSNKTMNDDALQIALDFANSK